MPRPSVVELREFYASLLGQRVRHYLTLAVREDWPELAGDTLLGIGYANPLLRSFLREDRGERSGVFSLMPAPQGAIVWPDYADCRAVLYEPGRFPIGDNQINRLLLLHALEHSVNEEQLLEECWRVLTPGGRMLLIVPSRRSIWSRGHHTPFSYGRPYTAAQLRAVVCQKFTHLSTRSALSFAPSHSRFLLGLSGLIEKLSFFIAPMIGGVIIMQVEKQIYAGLKEKRSEGLFRPVYVPAGVKPAMNTRDKS